MISEFFIDCGFAVADGFFSLLPEMEWTVETSAWTYAGDILDMICYLLPLGTVTAIISLIVGVTVVRIAISFIRTIIGLIPFI